MASAAPPILSGSQNHVSPSRWSANFDGEIQIARSSNGPRHSPLKAGCAGSNPARATTGSLRCLGRTSEQRLGVFAFGFCSLDFSSQREFSDSLAYASVAQPAEQRTVNPWGRGSNPLRCARRQILERVCLFSIKS